MVSLTSQVIKICGLREFPHFETAANAGADFLGMVFVPWVRRYINPEEAREVVKTFRKNFRFPSDENKAYPSFVGLFFDQPSVEVNRIAESVGLDWVQLCGQEGIEYWKSIESRILKVLHVPSLEDSRLNSRQTTLESLQRSLDAVENHGGFPILDRASSRQPGGTGKQFDWTLAKELSARHHKFILAGGLSPANLPDAIKTAAPYGVDVSSGVETDQSKDPQKIRDFVRIARKLFSNVQDDES